MEVPWLILTLFIFPLIIILLQFFINTSKTSSSKLPPGPPKLPFIGNLHQLAWSNTLPHRRLAELATVYGPIMHLHLGEVPTIVISTPEMAKEVMKTHDAVFCSRPPLVVAKEIFYDSTDIGMAPYDEYWRQVRKIAVVEMFTTKRVEAFRPIREEEVVDLMESLRLEEGCVVNLSKKLFALSFNITSRVALNMRGKEQEEFQAFATGVTQASSGFCVGDVYPSMKWLHLISGMNKRLRKLVKEANRILDPMIEEHKSKKKRNEGKKKEEEEENKDLVDVLLKFHKDSYDHLKNTPRDEFFLSTNNIKAIVLDLFGAGSETSSATMEWTLSELLKDPTAMKKAQEEVRRVYQGKQLVDETRLHELKYLKLVIKEILRLHPPLPLLVPRESMERSQLQGYDIPSKTRVIVNAWAIGRDPIYWQEPHRFNPERFEDSSVDYKGTNFELIPFGAGRRKCPGIALGITNIELSLAMLLYHFDWKLPRGVEGPQLLDMDESYGITTRRKNDLHVIPIRYI